VNCRCLPWVGSYFGYSQGTSSELLNLPHGEGLRRKWQARFVKDRRKAKVQFSDTSQYKT